MSELFSERLRALRKDRTRADFARFLGIPAPMYHRYERRQVPKENNLRVIADKCGVTVDWLLGRDPSAQPPQMVREVRADYAGHPPSIGLTYFTNEEIATAARRALDAGDHAAAHSLTGELMRRAAEKAKKEVPP